MKNLNKEFEKARLAKIKELQGKLSELTRLWEDESNKVTVKEFLPKGSVIVFPSFVWHRVKPVTKGVRYSLVAWSIGYPFK